jgi:glutamate-1-semialdehyde aminotransferase
MVLIPLAGGMLSGYANIRSTLSVHEVRISAMEKHLEVLTHIERRLQHIDARTIRIEAVLEEQEKQRQQQGSGGRKR